MSNILDEIKKQRERTGLTIHQNVFDFGSAYVKDEDGRILHYGSYLTCQFFIQEYDDLIKEKSTNQ